MHKRCLITNGFDKTVQQMHYQFGDTVIAIRKRYEKKKTLPFTKENQEAFEKTSIKTSKTAINHHFDVSKETRVKCDGSQTKRGASIEQNHNDV